MDLEEKVARIIARALGHNDDNGMYWEDYVLAARLLIKEGLIAPSPKAQERDIAGNIPVRDEFGNLLSRMPVEVTAPPKAQE